MYIMWGGGGGVVRVYYVCMPYLIWHMYYVHVYVCIYHRFGQGPCCCQFFLKYYILSWRGGGTRNSKVWTSCYKFTHTTPKPNRPAAIIISHESWSKDYKRFISSSLSSCSVRYPSAPCWGFWLLWKGQDTTSREHMALLVLQKLFSEWCFTLPHLISYHSLPFDILSLSPFFFFF